MSEPRTEGDRVWELLDKLAILRVELANHTVDWRELKGRYDEEIQAIEQSMEDARLHRHQASLPGVG